MEIRYGAKREHCYCIVEFSKEFPRVNRHAASVCFLAYQQREPHMRCTCMATVLSSRTFVMCQHKRLEWKMHNETIMHYAVT
jgi:hypothetical protein